jgi:hypothetical protein
VLRRELAIAFGARLSWVAAACSAILVGHGFVLALDLYSASSRSAQASLLQAREMDPLLGVVRPTLGGLYLAISLLGALVAVRPIAIEKERHSLRPLLLQTVSPRGVLTAKVLAGLTAVLLQGVAPVGLLLAWRALGGHLALNETASAALAYLLYMLLVTALAGAAAAWTETFAQAATVVLLAIAASWAIDASEGFAALAWLGRALDWSVTTHLEPLERGTLALGSVLWLLAAAAGLFGLSWIGLRYDLSRMRRSALAMGTITVTGLACWATGQVRTRIDTTEAHRVSLPPAAVRGLRALGRPIALDVYLDRDDSRRRQLEGDVLARLRLARSDVSIRMPLDERIAAGEVERDDSYGQIVVRVGTASRTTTSTSRKELVTLIFEAAGLSLPDWSQLPYEGYPLVVEGPRRAGVAILAYGAFPMGLLGAGMWLTRSRRRPST